MRQITIAKAVEGVGIGLHKGEPIRLRLEPMPENSGIIFYRSDLGISIECKPQNVVDTKMATVIGKGGATISTIEHLLSVIYSYGIDNIRIVVDGPEIPIMDGSGASFCMLLDEAGIKKLNSNKRVMLIKREIEVKIDKKYVKILPSKISEFEFKIDFNHPIIKSQEYRFIFSKKEFIENIARARTFGFLRDIQMLRSMGLALGGSLENAIVLDDRRILNSEGLRYNNEFVRHKILDAIGDLSLLGVPVIGKYKSFAGSHHLNHLLTKEILKEKENYEIKEIDSLLEIEMQKAYA